MLSFVLFLMKPEQPAENLQKWWKVNSGKHHLALQNHQEKKTCPHMDTFYHLRIQHTLYFVCEPTAFTSSRLDFTASQQVNHYYTSVFMKFLLRGSINSGRPSTHTASSCFTPMWPETTELLQHLLLKASLQTWMHVHGCVCVSDTVKMQWIMHLVDSHLHCMVEFTGRKAKRKAFYSSARISDALTV